MTDDLYSKHSASNKDSVVSNNGISINLPSGESRQIGGNLGHDTLGHCELGPLGTWATGNLGHCEHWVQLRFGSGSSAPGAVFFSYWIWARGQQLVKWG